MTLPTVQEIDHGIKFLTEEADRLRKSQQGKEYWAVQKCRSMDTTRETLRKVRQHVQMTGMNQKPIA